VPNQDVLKVEVQVCTAHLLSQLSVYKEIELDLNASLMYLNPMTDSYGYDYARSSYYLYDGGIYFGLTTSTKGVMSERGA
jgi:hypothetical protein